MVTCVDTSADPSIADELTLDRARRGDSDALAGLWVIYQPQVLRLLRSRGRSAAEDIASQVWIDVGRIREDGKPVVVARSYAHAMVTVPDDM